MPLFILCRYINFLHTSADDTRCGRTCIDLLEVPGTLTDRGSTSTEIHDLVSTSYSLRDYLLLWS